MSNITILKYAESIYPYRFSGVPLGVSSIGRPPKPVANQKQGATKEDTEQGDTSKGSRLQGDSSNGDNAKGGSQGDSLKGGTQVLRVVAKAAAAKASLGPPIRRKPFSQSYGVGLLEAGVTGGGWFDNPGSVVEPHVGEGGAKRGEYEVRGESTRYEMRCAKHSRC